MSIFKKDCPQCATANNVDAVRCRCGYCFDTDALAEADANAYAEEQDRLYRDYLAARIVQAEVELRVAREQAKSDPSNTLKSAAALVAEQAFNALQAEMKQLKLRLELAQRGAPKRVPPAAKPIARPVTPSATPPARAVAPLTKFAVAKRAEPKATPAEIRQAEQRAQLARREKALSAQPQSLKKQAARMATTMQKTPAVANASATSAAPAQPPKPSVSPVPNTRFRQHQAQKAEAIIKAQAVNYSKPQTAATPAPRPAVSVEPIKKQHSPNTQECPNCTAAVALTVARCRCGYEFSQTLATPAAVAPSDPLVASSREATHECPNCTATLPLSRTKCKCGFTLTTEPTDQVPALPLDPGTLAILTEGLTGWRRR